MSGTDALHEQLAELGRALQAFEEPLVAEHAGLRLMRDTLQEREAQIREQIRKAETCALRVTVDGSVARTGRLRLRFALELLAALQAAVDAAARALDVAAEPGQETDAVALHLAEFDGGDPVTLLLERSPGAVDAQLVTADGDLVVERALAAVLDALDADADPAAPPEPVGEALGRLARLLAAEPVRVTFALSPMTVEPRTVTLTRPAAQHLAGRADPAS